MVLTKSAADCTVLLNALGTDGCGSDGFTEDDWLWKGRLAGLKVEGWAELDGDS